jgi:predicted amidohydrolase
MPFEWRHIYSYKISKTVGLYLLNGTMPIADPHDANKVMAACLIYNDLGERVARYDKIHLFDVHVPGSDEVYRESDTISKGIALAASLMMRSASIRLELILGLDAI